MSIKRTLILSALLGVVTAGAANAATPVELNSRQGIDNATRNRISSVVLEAMLVEGAVGGTVSRAQQRSSGCSTEIGNRDSSGSLLDRDQSVIVVGDVINVCR